MVYNKKSIRLKLSVANLDRRDHMTLGEIIVAILQTGFIVLLVPLAVIAVMLIKRFSNMLIAVGLVLLAIDIAIHGTVEKMSEGAGMLAILLCVGIAVKMFLFIMRH